jgi:DNA-binding TFAR19-related protein (PDSD5 family)
MTIDRKMITEEHKKRQTHFDLSVADVTEVSENQLLLTAPMEIGKSEIDDKMIAQVSIQCSKHCPNYLGVFCWE